MVGPLTVGAITTILAFLPFLFIASPAYQIVNVFPYVAIFVLLVSLVAAFFILPAHLSHGRRWSLSPLSDVQSQVGGWLDEVRDRVVAPAASWTVRNVWLAIVGGVLVLVAAALLIGFVPFVVSMLGGLTFSTLSILFVLPALVMVAEGRRE